MATTVHSTMMRQIDHGIRVTFLLSVLAVPVSYLTQVVLARTSHEAVGLFAGVLLWAGFVQCFYYFGGNPVLIRYLPIVPAPQRPSFLLSYGAMVLGLTLLGMLFFSFVPDLFRSFAGPTMGGYVFPLFFLVALVTIFYQVAVTALKALLELAVAQVLIRVSTVGYLVVFGTFFFIARDWFQLHMFAVIAAAYLAVLTLSSSLAWFYLVRALRSGAAPLRWYVPEGFWRFSLLTQASSIVNFFASRLDQVLVLAYGSISGLGIYFILVQLAAAIQLISGFFLDGLFPALSNVLTRVGPEAARAVYYQGARFNQVIITTSALLLLCFHKTILSTFGAQYPNYWPVFFVLVVFSGLNSMGTLNAYLLIGTGRMDLLLYCQGLQVTMFLVLFQLLNAKQSLFMLALANGLAMSGGLLATIVATLRLLPFELRIPREFWASLVTLLMATGVAAWAGPSSLAGSVFLFVITEALFLVLGGYRRKEILCLVSLVRLPGTSERGSPHAAKIFRWPLAEPCAVGNITKRKSMTEIGQPRGVAGEVEVQ